MEQEKNTSEGQMIERIFEQPADSVSFYSDLGQVFGTGHEVMLQFYETIPGPPDREQKITKVRTRLQATITISYSHAQNLGKLLLEKSKEQEE